MVPLKSKTFQSVLKDPPYSKPFKRRPIWVRTDKGKEFLNESFQKLLKREGIQFQVCRNPDIKCSIVERVQRTVRDKLYKYFKHKNTYRYVDVLSDFVSVYNATVHVSTGMAPANVKDSEILELWKRMQKIRGKVRVKDARYSVGQHVRISKGKAKSAKVGRTKFQYGDLSNYQSDTQDPAPRVRTGRFKSKGDRRAILRGRTNSRTHHETDAVSDQ